MRYKIPLREARAAFDQRRAFNCNDTLRGHYGSPTTYGRLAAMWVAYIRQFRDQIVYSVVSYDTPIAWVMRDGRVIVPPAWYSQTTSRHVSALRLRYSPAPAMSAEAA